MSDVIDLATRRARSTPETLPTREADIELQAWVKDGEIDWIWSNGPFFAGEPDHKARTAALADIAWMYGDAANPDVAGAGDRPVFWVLLRGDGNLTFIYQRSLFEGTSAKHAFWFARQWWRVTKKMAALAWRIGRGRG